MASMLSTIDNPFNPFENFDEWLTFDSEKQYNSCGLLARIAHTSDELSDSDNELEIENAIDEILKFDPLGIRIKVKSNDKIIPISIEQLNNENQK